MFEMCQMCTYTDKMRTMSGRVVCTCSNPTAKGGMQNGNSVETFTRCIHIFACLASICMLKSVIINKISASELSRIFIKSALLVGRVFTVPVGIPRLISTHQSRPPSSRTSVKQFCSCHSATRVARSLRKT